MLKLDLWDLSHIYITSYWKDDSTVDGVFKVLDYLRYEYVDKGFFMFIEVQGYLYTVYDFYLSFILR